MCDRCEELEERVRQLEYELTGPKHFPASWKLSPGQRTILGLLVTRGRVTYSAARLTLWDDPPDGADDITRRHIFNLRSRLQWLRIDTIRGEGWELSREQRSRVEQEMVS